MKGRLHLDLNWSATRGRCVRWSPSYCGTIPRRDIVSKTSHMKLPALKSTSRQIGSTFERCNVDKNWSAITGYSAISRFPYKNENTYDNRWMGIARTAAGAKTRLWVTLSTRLNQQKKTQANNETVVKAFFLFSIHTDLLKTNFCCFCLRSDVAVLGDRDAEIPIYADRKR